MTIVVTLMISGEDKDKLTQYASDLADMMDQAMELQEQNHNVPEGIVYEGVSAIDPEEPEIELLTDGSETLIKE